MDIEESLKKLALKVFEKARLFEDGNYIEVTAAQTDIADLILKWAEKDYSNNEVKRLQDDKDSLEEEKEESDKIVAGSKDLCKKLMLLHNLD